MLQDAYYSGNNDHVQSRESEDSFEGAAGTGNFNGEENTEERPEQNDGDDEHNQIFDKNQRENPIVDDGQWTKQQHRGKTPLGHDNGSVKIGFAP